MVRDSESRRGPRMKSIAWALHTHSAAWLYGLWRKILRPFFPERIICSDHFLPDFQRARVISGGSSGIVERLPCGHVRKMPYPDDDAKRRESSLKDLQREREVYQRIAPQRHILEMVQYSAGKGIVLQGMPNGTLRDYLKSEGAQITVSQRTRWAASIASTLHALHSSQIIHGDLKPENVLLDDSLEPYVIDFSGSSIDGKQGSAMENVRFFQPRTYDAASTVETDLFALGSTIYEIMTGKEPYEEFSDDEVEQLYTNEVFPDVDTIPCGNIIRKCWTREISSAQEAHASILKQHTATNSYFEWLTSMLGKITIQPA